MKIITWNIAPGYNDDKKASIIRVLDDSKPDIFVIIEGPINPAECTAIDNDIKSKGYDVYFSPNFASDPKYSSQLDFHAFGLKVYIKNGTRLEESFSFENQKFDGRVVYLRFEFNSKKYSTFLIHGLSLGQTEMRHIDFFFQLRRMILMKTFDYIDEGVIIMGDINQQPWSEVVTNRDNIYSFFENRRLEYYKSHHEHPEQMEVSFDKRMYFNPVIDYLRSSMASNYLIGTYYKDSVTSILDYPLIDKNTQNYTFEIIHVLSDGYELLKKKRIWYHIENEIDHLPILLELN